MLADLWNSLPVALRDPVALAVPVFLAVIILEALAAWRLEEPADDAELQLAPDGRVRREAGAWERRDATASISMGVVSVATSAAWKALALLLYAVVFAYVAPWQLSSTSIWTWVIALLGIDFLFYWEHRVAHRVRLVWATHQAHHSSEYFNFATALRQKWNNSAQIVVWLPLPLLGVPPWIVFTSYAANLVYQFFVHTEKVDKLPAPIEAVFNTPSHHRVHHGRDPEYLDRNYAGVLIIWDRMFGTFQPELHRPNYGLTKPVDTFNIVKLQLHEYGAIIRDVRESDRLRDKLGYVFGPPGWQPSRGIEPADGRTPTPV